MSSGRLSWVEARSRVGRACRAGGRAPRGVGGPRGVRSRGGALRCGRGRVAVAGWDRAHGAVVGAVRCGRGRVAAARRGSGAARSRGSRVGFGRTVRPGRRPGSRRFARSMECRRLVRCGVVRCGALRCGRGRVAVAGRTLRSAAPCGPVGRVVRLRGGARSRRRGVGRPRETRETSTKQRLSAARLFVRGESLPCTNPMLRPI